MDTNEVRDIMDVTMKL